MLENKIKQICIGLAAFTLSMSLNGCGKVQVDSPLKNYEKVLNCYTTPDNKSQYTCEEYVVPLVEVKFQR